MTLEPKLAAKPFKVAVYSQSNLSRDARVFRQIELLGEMGAEISLFGLSCPEGSIFRFFDLGELIGFPTGRSLCNDFRSVLRIGVIRILARYIANVVCRKSVLFGVRDWLEIRIIRGRAVKVLRSLKPDVIVANDLSSLNVCVAAKGEARLIYDAHEYSPGQLTRGFSANSREGYADFLLKKYLPLCDSMMTIGIGIAELYESRYGVKPVVITNAPRHRELPPSIRSDGLIRLVHHGNAVPRRRLEDMIDLIILLDDRFTLDFFLIPKNPEYVAFLKSRAGGDARIRFNDPVPMQRLPEELNRFDVGLRFYEPDTLNLQYGLPNKFFDFIQARLAVAVGPTPETRKYVERYGIGVLSKDFSPASMAAALSVLTTEEIRRFKNNSDSCAYELSAEPNREIMRTLFQDQPS